jgi:hypothetical protein
MSLDDLFMPLPVGGVRGRVIAGEMPPLPKPLTEAQLAQRRVARLKQNGKPKAANRTGR